MSKKKTPIQTNKNFLMILLSSVLVIGLSIMIVKNKQNDTTKPDATSWNTYKSEIYKFEFKYPKPWAPVLYSPGRMIEEDVWLINKPEYISNINEYSYTKNDFSSIFIKITKFGKEVSLGSKNVIYDKNTNLKNFATERTGAPDSEIEKYKLDNKYGYLRTYKFGDRLDKQIFVKTDEGFLELSYHEGQNDIYSTVKSDFLDILSTFKFTD